MNVFQLELAKDFIEDSESIFLYLCKIMGETYYARRYINEIKLKCVHYASLPVKMGRPRPELGENIRSIPYKNYILYLRYEDKKLIILRIIYGSRDVISHKIK